MINKEEIGVLIIGGACLLIAYFAWNYGFTPYRCDLQHKSICEQMCNENHNNIESISCFNNFIDKNKTNIGLRQDLIECTCRYRIENKTTINGKEYFYYSDLKISEYNFVWENG